MVTGLVPHLREAFGWDEDVVISAGPRGALGQIWRLDVGSARYALKEIFGKPPSEADLGWYYSAPLAVPVLGGALCRIVVDGYNDDQRQEDFHEAIRAFLALDPSALAAASPSIFAYYRDAMNDVVAARDRDRYVEIDGPNDVLDHVRFGDEPAISRDTYGDRHVYVSLECECDWEPDHGLQIVFRDGRTVTKVGPYDGHLTNSAAYADDELDGVVYHRSH